jgi:hypothetical protein
MQDETDGLINSTRATSSGGYSVTSVSVVNAVHVAGPFTPR